MGAAQGSNVREGLEDSLWIGPGRLAESNADQVKKIRQVLEGLSLDIATPDEARQMLSLKGVDQVGIHAAQAACKQAVVTGESVQHDFQ